MTLPSPQICREVKRCLGSEQAEIFLFTKSGLSERVDMVATGHAPRDFFYNFFDLIEKQVDVCMLNTSVGYQGMRGCVSYLGERLWARLSGISTRRRFLEERRDLWSKAHVLISFTDHFSLTLGDYFRRQHHRPVTVGLFHGLSDFPTWISPFGRLVVDTYIRRCLSGLDVVGFFGAVDMAEAKRRYGLSDDRATVIRFGVDTSFWRPASSGQEPPAPGTRPSIVSVGSDPSRDYETLIKANLPCDVRIITRIPLRIPSAQIGVTVTQGSYWSTDLTDVDLRDLYQRADAVVVPLKDVFQPTGYSVTLQAMACGAPVILSDIKGLWAPELLTDSENCLLVAPGRPDHLRQAVERLQNDADLAARLRVNGRKTVEKHFSLVNMNECLMSVIQRAQKLRSQNASSFSPRGLTAA